MCVFIASPGKGKLFEGKPIAHFHRSLEERVAAANRFVQECEFRGEVVCDTMANEVQTNLDAYPERILIVEKGVVVHRGGAGPLLFFDIDDVLAWCNKHDHRTPEEKAVNKAAQGEDSSEVQECAT